MTDLNWDEVIEDENRLIDNSDRKHRDHFNSLETMSEELLFKASLDKYDPDEILSEIYNDDFTQAIKSGELRNALIKLTAKQLRAIEMYYFQGYNQYEIAERICCSQKNVSSLISKAILEIKKYLHI